MAQLNLPRISIVMPSYNQRDFIEASLRSVLDQNYPDLEFIVIDGASTDGSVDLIRQYEDRLAYWVSEKDAGQTSAINKGLARATGEIVAWLASDDLYLPGALHAIAHEFVRQPLCRWLTGRCVQFGLPDRPPELLALRLPRDAVVGALFLYQAPQPGHFYRRELFEKFGLFDEAFNYCFDHEFYVRMLLGGEVCSTLEYPVAAYRLHPKSKTIAESDRFLPEGLAVREKHFSQLSVQAARRTRKDARHLYVGARLGEADQAWRRGERGRALELGLLMLTVSPVTVASLVLQRARRLAGGDTTSRPGGV